MKKRKNTPEVNSLFLVESTDVDYRLCIIELKLTIPGVYDRRKLYRIERESREEDAAVKELAASIDKEIIERIFKLK